MILSFTNVSNAQKIYASNSSNSNESIQTAAPLLTTEKNAGKSIGKNTTSVAIPESNPRLKARFSGLFPKALNQQWAVLDKSYYVSFLNNGRKSRASFTQNGTMNYAIPDCTMEQLPEALRNMIRKNYPEHTLFNGIEINAYDEVTYQVVLENATGYITLKSNGETIEKIQQVNKTN